MSATKTRLLLKDIDQLPALMSIKDLAPILGYGEIYTARLCKEGAIPATKVGREWRIPTRKALEKLGMM